MFVASFACIALAEFPVAVVLLSFWGASTAFSRALLGRHYVGDVLAGIAIGPLITAIITKVR
jgi:membrane-associated phospholipid phosphatase